MALTDPKKRELSDSWLLSESCPALLQAKLPPRREGSHLVPGWEGTRQSPSAPKIGRTEKGPGGPRWPQVAPAQTGEGCQAFKLKSLQGYEGQALALRWREDGWAMALAPQQTKLASGCETRCPRLHPSCVPRRWRPWPSPSCALHLTPATWTVKEVTRLPRRVVGQSERSAPLGQELAGRKRCRDICYCHHMGIKSPCASQEVTMGRN